MSERGVLKREALFYKVLFIAMMAFMNILVFINPDVLGQKMYKNYLKIGRLTETDRLQFQLMSEATPNSV